ncbi:hypothetical protein ACFJYJ_13405 [Enterococcus faecalis]|uniref:hypothetical protein n=1 Tax=Enterococcus faecalis TaxID=1351 RepID=UPI0032DEEDD4
MSDTLLIGITGFVATLVTAYFSNSHSVKIKAMEIKQVVYTKEVERNYKILDDFLSALLKLSTLEIRLYDTEWKLLPIKDEDKIAIFSEYKEALGPILSIVSEELFEKIIYADGRIDSAEVSIGLLQMNRLIPDIRKEVKQQTLKIDQQI